MTAALYALRNGKTVTIFEQNSIGGQIAQSPRVENFPSIKSISGLELADKMFSQITDLGVDFKFGEVLSMEKTGNNFLLKTEFESVEARAVIIATGVEHRRMNLENEEKFIGKGISYCALCDGAFYADEEVCLIGDGNTALQYALLLSSICKGVRVFTLFDKFFGDKTLVDAVKSKPNIKITHNVNLIKYLGEDKLSGLVFAKKEGGELKVDTKAVFIAIGQVANNKKFLPLVELDKNGFIIADEDMATLTPGLFVAGDCRLKKVKQLTTACNDGAIAATSACTYLESL